MKTPEEIKHGLECCASVGACISDRCEYYLGGNLMCTRELARDAMEYINELEARAPRLGDMGELIKMLRACQHDQCICDECIDGENVKHWRKLMGMAADALEAIAVDAEPVRHGSNITYTHPSYMFMCTECGFTCEITELRYDDDGMVEPDAYEYDCKFCPNCGEMIDGGRSEL